jgi:hypothetical protein
VDSALAQLRVLVTIPSFWKLAAIRLMPPSPSLRIDPRLVKLLESAAK